MRVLVATHETSGTVAGDFDYCVEGELVYMQEPCDRDRRDPDGGCGCGRAFSGLSSHRATTTARVAELELSPDDIRRALRDSLEAGGWIDPSFCTSEQADEWVEDLYEQTQELVRQLPVGAIVRRRLDHCFPARTET